jgi:penicillin-binding protein 2
MRAAIEKSCNAYFWSMGLQTDPQRTTEMVNYLG